MRLDEATGSSCGLLRALVGEERRIPRSEVVGLGTAEQSKDIESVLVALTVGALSLADLVTAFSTQAAGGGEAHGGPRASPPILDATPISPCCD